MFTEKTLKGLKGYITYIIMKLNMRIYSRLNPKFLIQAKDFSCTQSRCGLGPIIWANMSYISLIVKML